MRPAPDGEARLRATIEGSLDCVYLLDAVRGASGDVVDLVFVDVNQRGLDLIAMDRDEVIGRSLCDLCPHNCTEGFVDKYSRIIETGKPLEEELSIARPGEHMWLRHQIVKVGDGVAITTRDVTHRRLADEEQRQTAEKLAAIVQSSPLAILTLDVHGRVTMWNAAAERLFGWTADEVLGRLLPTIPDDRGEEFEALRAHALSGRDLTDVETQRVRKDGTLVDVSISLAPTRDASGRISGHLTLIADISERRRLEEHVFEAQKMDALGRLASGIAHDFNNVLTAITGSADLALGGLGADQISVRHEVEQIRAAADRAASLTRELLAFGRPRDFQANVVDVGESVAGMEDFLRRLLAGSVEVHVEPADPGCAARIDPIRLQQVVINLVVNACDAMPQRGSVTIGTRLLTIEAHDELGRRGLTEGSYVALSVADEGVGMDEETVARAFEPFFTTKDDADGTGLGLSIVYWAVSQAGGAVLVDTAPGEGTTVTVYLPYAA